MSDSMVTQSAFGGDDLERLLLRLDPERTVASKKYEGLRRTVFKFFDWNRSLRAEELADDTLNRVAERLKTENIQNVSAYALGVARHVLQEDLKKHRRESSVEDIPGGIDAIVDYVDTEQQIVDRLDQQIRLACLQECRAKLEPEDSAFVVAYYSADGEKQKVHRKRLSGTEGMTMAALRTRAHRLREELERCVIRCLDNRRKAFTASGGRRQAELR
jgi:hypothetical protein